MDRTNTKSQISSIRNLLRGVVREHAAHSVRKGHIRRDPLYSSLMREQELKKANDAFGAFCADAGERMLNCIEAMRTSEAVLNSTFDIGDPALQNAIRLIESAGGKLHKETVGHLAEQFKGNHQALLALDALFTRYGMDKTEISPYIMDIEKFTDALKDAATKIKGNAGNVTGTALLVNQAVSAYICNVGADDESEDTSLGDLTPYYTDIFEQAKKNGNAGEMSGIIRQAAERGIRIE